MSYALSMAVGFALGFFVPSLIAVAVLVPIASVGVDLLLFKFLGEQVAGYLGLAINVAVVACGAAAGIKAADR